MNRNEKYKGILYSWPVLIITLIGFFPIGIILICIRCDKDKTAAFTVGKIIGVLGCLWIVAFFKFFYPDLDPELSIPGYIVVILIFGTAPVIMIYYSLNSIREGKRYKKYIAAIVDGEEYNLNNISTIVGQPLDRVKKDLEMMIRRDDFVKAYIDEEKGILYIQEIHGPQAKYASNQKQTSGVKQPPRAFKCRYCGANNASTSGNVCDYCGTERF